MLRILGSRILIEKDQKKETTKSGIILASEAQEPLFKGFVRGWGDKTELNLKEGQKVIYSKYSGEEIEYEDKKYLLLREEDVLGIEE